MKRNKTRLRHITKDFRVLKVTEFNGEFFIADTNKRAEGKMISHFMINYDVVKEKREKQFGCSSFKQEHDSCGIEYFTISTFEKYLESKNWSESAKNYHRGEFTGAIEFFDDGSFNHVPNEKYDTILYKHIPNSEGYTIEDLRFGKVACTFKYNCSEEELKLLLRKTFNLHIPISYLKGDFIVGKDIISYSCHTDTNLPTQSVKDFLN